MRGKHFKYHFTLETVLVPLILNYWIVIINNWLRTTFPLPNVPYDGFDKQQLEFRNMEKENELEHTIYFPKHQPSKFPNNLSFMAYC